MVDAGETICFVVAVAGACPIEVADAGESASIVVTRGGGDAQPVDGDGVYAVQWVVAVAYRFVAAGVGQLGEVPGFVVGVLHLEPVGIGVTGESVEGIEVVGGDAQRISHGNQIISGIVIKADAVIGVGDGVELSRCGVAGGDGLVIAICLAGEPAQFVIA